MKKLKKLAINKVTLRDLDESTLNMAAAAATDVNCHTVNYTYCAACPTYIRPLTCACP